jgi:hypothetical protein
MSAAESGRGTGNRVARPGVFAAMAVASLLVARVWAGQESAFTAGRGETVSGAAAARVVPNYALEERFLPEAVNKLVFDLSVTPHWFNESDRFWYSYQTTDGTRYYVVDPVEKSKVPLWDNAKVAAELSRLTNFPYDAQHLPVKRLKLVDKDRKMRLEVEIRKNAVGAERTKERKEPGGRRRARQRRRAEAGRAAGSSGRGSGGGESGGNADALF